MNKKKPKYKPFKKWNARDYDMSVNTIAENIRLTHEQWSILRLAIRTAVEQNS